MDLSLEEIVNQTKDDIQSNGCDIEEMDLNWMLSVDSRHGLTWGWFGRENIAMKGFEVLNKSKVQERAWWPRYHG